MADTQNGLCHRQQIYVVTMRCQIRKKYIKDLVEYDVANWVIAYQNHNQDSTVMMMCLSVCMPSIDPCLYLLRALHKFWNYGVRVASVIKTNEHISVERRLSVWREELTTEQKMYSFGTLPPQLDNNPDLNVYTETCQTRVKIFNSEKMEMKAQFAPPALSPCTSSQDPWNLTPCVQMEQNVLVKYGPPINAQGAHIKLQKRSFPPTEAASPLKIARGSDGNMIATCSYTDKPHCVPVSHDPSAVSVTDMSLEMVGADVASTSSTDGGRYGGVCVPLKKHLLGTLKYMENTGPMGSTHDPVVSTLTEMQNVSLRAFGGNIGTMAPRKITGCNPFGNGVSSLLGSKYGDRLSVRKRLFVEDHQPETELPYALAVDESIDTEASYADATESGYTPADELVGPCEDYDCAPATESESEEDEFDGDGDQISEREFQQWQEY